MFNVLFVPHPKFPELFLECFQGSEQDPDNNPPKARLRWVGEHPSISKKPDDQCSFVQIVDHGEHWQVLTTPDDSSVIKTKTRLNIVGSELVWAIVDRSADMTLQEIAKNIPDIAQAYESDNLYADLMETPMVSITSFSPRNIHVMFHWWYKGRGALVSINEHNGEWLVRDVYRLLYPVTKTCDLMELLRDPKVIAWLFKQNISGNPHRLTMAIVELLRSPENLDAVVLDETPMEAVFARTPLFDAIGDSLHPGQEASVVVVSRNTPDSPVWFVTQFGTNVVIRRDTPNPSEPEHSLYCERPLSEFKLDDWIKYFGIARMCLEPENFLVNSLLEFASLGRSGVNACS